MITNKSISDLKKNVSVGDNAIVVGGSIAGMLAARVLAEKFSTVTIIELDKLPERPGIRKGVPQSTQPHTLLVKGYRILEKLFPGIGAELSADGALSIDWAQEFHHFHCLPNWRGWSATAQSPSDIVSFTCSRPLLEWAIRQRITKFTNVHFIEQHRVIGLLCNSSKTQVMGVRLRSVAGSDEDDLPATLVVDASGRCSHSPEWLRNLGFTSPSETIVNSFLSYATRRYREPKGFRADWKIMVISHTPEIGTRQSYLAKIEGGEWIATLGSFGHDMPPTDNEGFLQFARSLPSPKFYEAIINAEPISPIYAYRATANRLRHYERIKLPQGFVVLGDAVCALCPIYGQGITVSALSAIVLLDWLNEGSLIPSHFQESLAKSNHFHWASATIQDSRFPSTVGGSNQDQITTFLHWYTEQAFLLANRDPELHKTVVKIIHLLRSPLALYHPKIIFQVLTQKSTLFNISDRLFNHLVQSLSDESI